VKHLTSYDFDISYNTAADPLHTFYIPALERSVRVLRGTGYYSSSSLAVAAAGVSRLIENGGRMEIFCGAQLTESDVAAISQGESLEEVLGERLAASTPPPSVEDYKSSRLSVLAWLIAENRLDIHVVLSVDSNGKPLPASEVSEYFHPKMGLFEDSAGNKMSMYGSINETAQGWTKNYENFLVNCSWDREGVPAGKLFIKQAESEFERLRCNSAPGWCVMPIPVAAKKQLLKYYLPAKQPSSRDPLESVPPEKSETPSSYPNSNTVGAFLRDAPRMPGALWLGAASCTVSPWPHQRKIYASVVDSYPSNYMFCDEVGLGKTIEAGLVLRQLAISGRVKRCLLLVPRAVQKQWQEEMWEKFSLNIPMYSGGVVRDVFGLKLDYNASKGVWNSFDMLIATSHLAKRAERRPELLAADKYDLVIVDEAHHARRKDFLDTNAYRPNSLLTLLTGEDGNGGLVQNTSCIYLLTATPMQVNPVEVWDLLKVLGMGGLWGSGKEEFLRFFHEVRLPFDERDWAFLFRMVNDCLQAGIDVDPAICAMGESKLGHIQWKKLLSLITNEENSFSTADHSEDFLAVLDSTLRSTTPIRTMMWRNTRNLLREYREKGLLDAVVPIRKPRNQWIVLEDSGDGSEWELYTRIEEYISNFYRKYEQKRKGLGFVMTVYRKRLTSSFYAFEKSMERRLAFLENRISGDELLTEEDLEEESLFEDIDEADADSYEADLAAEKVFVEKFLDEIRRLPGDSKYESLVKDIHYFLNRRETLIVFTQYTDTMDYLREKLQMLYGKKIACYSGRGGERWNGNSWITVPKEEIKNDFRKADELKILLCTESASEGLNLQTCGVLINYDMPWNPMRVEQRIGRIDRIGQTHEDVWIRNYFIENTVEARVYQRLTERIGDFTTVVGRLQPILHGIEETIKAASMAIRTERERILSEKLNEIENQLKSTRLREFDLNEFVDATAEPSTISGTPATLKDIENWLINSDFPGISIKATEEDGVYTLSIHHDSYEVTFSPEVFDKYPNSLQLLTWGNPNLDLIFEKINVSASDSDCGYVALESPPFCSWYRNEEGDAVRIRTVDELKNREKSQITEVIASKAVKAFESILSQERTKREKISAHSYQWKRKQRLIKARNLLGNAILYKANELRFSGEVLSNATVVLKDAYFSLMNTGYPWKGIASSLGTLDSSFFQKLVQEYEKITLTESEARGKLAKALRTAESLLASLLDRGGSENDSNRIRKHLFP